jgi:negative regulator of flagellin synthesis FlgM
MHIYGPSQLHGAQSIGAPHNARQARPAGRTEAPTQADSVEISDAARALEQTHAMPDVRQGRIDEIRRQIADGTYETSDKLNTAVERMLDEIG